VIVVLMGTPSEGTNDTLKRGLVSSSTPVRLCPGSNSDTRRFRADEK